MVAGTIDLQPLFAEPILELSAFPPAYADHTNHVWRVRTASEDVVVRLPRESTEPNSPFWWGAKALFGVDPRNPDALVTVNAQLAELSSIAVPRALRVNTLDGRRCLIVEHLPGRRLESFNNLPLAAASALGEAIARVHIQRYAWWGTLAATTGQPLADFHRRLAATMRELVARFYGTDRAVSRPLAELSALAERLPPPEDASLTMLDVDGTQFLADGDRITGLVDTDAYVVAPRALDLIGYEYELDRPHADAFVGGYRAVLPLPDLESVRPLYRYFYRLLEVQGSVPLGIWFGWPAHFDRR